MTFPAPSMANPIQTQRLPEERKPLAVLGSAKLSKNSQKSIFKYAIDTHGAMGYNLP